ncbi:MAG: hypothetical protein JWN46_1624 [Acidimicrobiales bacterium]|nr:hypothetical protein [Acidimicrobiales bacterium]
MPALHHPRHLAAALLAVLIPVAPAARVAATRPRPTPRGGYSNMYPTANARWRCHDPSAGALVFCRADHAALSVGFDRSIGGRDAVTIVRALGQMRGTRLTVHGERPVMSGPNRTDIVYQAGRLLPVQVLGMTWCARARSPRRCDQHIVRFQAGAITTAVACHETGHAVGLTHGHEAAPRISSSDPRLGCMRTPDSGDSLLRTHNVDEINRTY